MNAMNATHAMNDSPLIWAEVDLGAIAHNVRELRRRTDPKAKVMAVVKANGYGHGAVEVARTALANVRRADNPPSGMRHDEMLKG